MRVGGGFYILFLLFFLRCERQCLNADGKKPAEREKVPIQHREKEQQMGRRPQGGEGSGRPPGSGVTAAGTESREGSAFQEQGEPILLSTSGPSGLWRFYVIIEQVTCHLWASVFSRAECYWRQGSVQTKCGDVYKAPAQA